MAAIEIIISGVLYDKFNRTTQSVALIGEASIAGLGIGGGPIIPPGQPPGIWGPTDPRPTPPIAWPPGWTGGVPPGGWDPNAPHPEHPIVIPPPPVDPPVDPIDPPPGSMTKPPPDDGGWGYSPEYGWGYFPGSDEPGPKRKGRRG